MIYLFKMVIFYGYVSSLEGVNVPSPRPSVTCTMPPSIIQASARSRTKACWSLLQLRPRCKPRTFQEQSRTCWGVKYCLKSKHKKYVLTYVCIYVWVGACLCECQNNPFNWPCVVIHVKPKSFCWHLVEGWQLIGVGERMAERQKIDTSDAQSSINQVCSNLTSSAIKGDDFP